MPHTIQIINNQILLLDGEGNGCDCHMLTNLSAAERRLERWRQEYEFDCAEAVQQLTEYLNNRAARRAHVEATIERIAKDVLGITTLRCRDSDQLDFHTLGVGAVRHALRAAYKAGRQSMK